MEQPVAIKKHMSQKEREYVESALETTFADLFDSMEIAWDNARSLETDFRSLIYGQEFDPRTSLQKSFQEFRDLQKQRR